MKQKLLKLRALLMVLMMAVGFGHAFAEDVVYKTALFGPEYNSKGVSNYTTSWTATNEMFTVNLQNWNNNNNGWSYVRAGSKSAASVATITTADFIDEKVTKVVLTIDAITSSAVNSIILYSGMTAEDISTEEGSFDIASGTQEVAISSPAANKFYKIAADCKKTSKNGTIQVSKVEFYKSGDTPDKTATKTTFNGEESYNVELGQVFTAPTASVDVEGASVTYSSSNTSVANVDENTGAVTLVGAGSTTITASYAGDDTYASSSDSYTLTVTKPVPVFESLEALAADGTLESGDIVKVSFQDVQIKDIYVNSYNSRQGIYFDIQKGGNDIEIYYSSEEVPETWLAGGTVSGTMQCAWKLYSNTSTWELAPDKGEWSWSNLTYTAPAGAKEVATIEFESKNSLEVNTADQYVVTYNGNGTLSVASTDENVATVEITEGNVVVTAKAVGTTTITVSAPETDEYYSASEQYTLTVTPAKIPFSRDVHKALVAEKDGKFYAAYNTFEGTNTYFHVKEVTVSNNKVYGLTDAEAAELAWNVTVDGTSATVRNLDNEYLELKSSGTKVYLSSEEVILFVAEDGSFHVDEGGRGFAYNVNNPRMSNYTIGTGYPAAVAMEFAAEGEVPTPTTANMKITAAKWGTFWAPFAVEIPEGVKAYTGEMKGDWIKMTEVEGVIPANTGVVVTSEQLVDVDLQAAESNPAELQTCYTGNTTGTVMAMEQGAYLLQKNFIEEKGEEVVGWYKVLGEGFTLAPNRCYLAKGAVAESRTFIGFEPVDGDATGISTIASQAATKADGKYMVKGQIVVVKSGKAYNVNGTQIK